MAKYQLSLQMSDGSTINAGQFACTDLTQVLVTLTAAGWSNKTQTYSNARINENSGIISSPTFDCYKAAVDANVLCASQSADGTVTFNCDEVPTTDLTFVLMIFNQ